MAGNEYGDELGFAPPLGGGSGAHVFWRGAPIWCPDLQMAAELLEKLSD